MPPLSLITQWLIFISISFINTRNDFSSGIGETFKWVLNDAAASEEQVWMCVIERKREEAQGESWGSTLNTRCSVKCFCRQHLFKKIIKEIDQTAQECLPRKYIPDWPGRWGRKAWQWFSAKDWSKILPRSSLLIARSLISPELYDK